MVWLFKTNITSKMTSFDHLSPMFTSNFSFSCHSLKTDKLWTESKDVLFKIDYLSISGDIRKNRKTQKLKSLGIFFFTHCQICMNRPCWYNDGIIITFIITYNLLDVFLLFLTFILSVSYEIETKGKLELEKHRQETFWVSDILGFTSPSF